MKCLICGVSEGKGDCAECRAIATEINANGEALLEMRDEPLPLLVVRNHPRRRAAWFIAAAAAVMVAVSVPTLMNLDRHLARPHHVTPREPLKVKMLTSDPDVVIFWLIDAPEGASR